MVPVVMEYAISQKRRCFAVMFIILSPVQVIASEFALTLYSGKYSDDRLGHVLLSKPVEFTDSYVAVAALSKIFTLESRSHQWEVEGQLGKHYDGQDHWEFNILALYRWQRFPWNHYLQTSVAIGDGLSYASETPPLEAQSTTNEGATRLLNYILVEFTFAPPQVDNWALVARVHHRSGVYGLFNDVEGGSNVLAAGVKFSFD
jgi:hypothetical protein